MGRADQGQDEQGNEDDAPGGGQKGAQPHQVHGEAPGHGHRGGRIVGFARGTGGAGPGQADDHGQYARGEQERLYSGQGEGGQMAAQLGQEIVGRAHEGHGHAADNNPVIVGGHAQGA